MRERGLEQARIQTPARLPPRPPCPARAECSTGSSRRAWPRDRKASACPSVSGAGYPGSRMSTDQNRGCAPLAGQKLRNSISPEISTPSPRSASSARARCQAAGCCGTGSSTRPSAQRLRDIHAWAGVVRTVTGTPRRLRLRIRGRPPSLGARTIARGGGEEVAGWSRLCRASVGYHMHVITCKIVRSLPLARTGSRLGYAAVTPDENPPGGHLWRRRASPFRLCEASTGRA